MARAGIVLLVVFLIIACGGAVYFAKSFSKNLDSSYRASSSDIDDGLSSDTPSQQPEQSSTIPTSTTTSSAATTSNPPVQTAKPTSTATGGSVTTVPGASPFIGGCRIFPASNSWNQDVSTLSVHPQSATFVNSIGLSRNLHPDFGTEYGIPYVIVDSSQPKVPITFTAYGDESDPGPYPIPPNAPVEGGGDRHVLVLQKGSCMLYELYAAEKNVGDSGWSADSGAIWNLGTGALRPEGWTSADAAGLPILPGLVRYDEVASGAINHAIRFTAPRTQRGYIHPATHQAGQNDTAYPPMGLRMRLKAGYDTNNLTGQARVIAVALKKYGMILADNGSSWFITGVLDSRWDDENLNQLKQIPGSAFEAVYTGDILR